MKERFVQELKQAAAERSEAIDELFLVADKSLGKTRHDKPYLRVKLIDRTGAIEAKVWERAEEIDALFDVSDCVRVRGRAEAYNGDVQINAQGITRVEPGGWRLGDFLPRTEFDPKAMMEELRGILDAMENRHLRALLFSFLDDPEIARKFMTAPAAQYIHHAWLGGLLEHVLSLSRLIRTIAPLYPGVDWDLVLVGALLHDLGKIEELSYQGPFHYTDAGQLIGHLTMGVLMVHDKIKTLPDFPKELELQVKHLIVGHHGALEYGSPKLPQTLEAVVLHHLDDLDSKINGIGTWLGQAAGKWTSYHRAYGRAFFKTPKADAADERDAD
ncbi:MAG: HD domain-containing protein [Myxococcales bacterium]|nr:HD domain-containing protein [Myxococcales bacterium]